MSGGAALIGSMLCAVAGAGCNITGADDGDDFAGYELLVTERSATTLRLQWAAMPDTPQNTYTVDYFTGFNSCVFPTDHSDVLHATGTTVQLTNLTPATGYNIHVHNLPGRNSSTYVVLVSTLPAGSASAPVTKADYQSCD